MARHFIQYFRKGGTIQETHLIGEFDMDHIGAKIFFDKASHRTSHIAVENETDGHGKPDHDTDQEIR